MMLTLSLSLSLSLSVAEAAPTVRTPTSTEVPTTYVGASCQVQSQQVCNWDAANDTMVCDVNAVGCGEGQMYSVRYSTATDGYSVFGQCTIGTNHIYACYIDDPSGEIQISLLRGSDNSEEPISHEFSPSKIMRPTHSGTFVAKIEARGGADLVGGTDFDSDYFDERLYGGDGADEVNYNRSNGADECYGGNGNDDVFAGFDSDGDWLHGGNGTDTLFGGPGPDWLHGGHGNGDELFGANGNDVLYGSLGAYDHLEGGGNNDVLCETSTPAPFCPAWNYMEGGGGTDIASIAVHPWCPAAGISVDGNGSVEDPKDPAIDWSAVSGVSGDPVPPWPSGCIDIVAWGGW